MYLENRLFKPSRQVTTLVWRFDGQEVYSIQLNVIKSVSYRRQVGIFLCVLRIFELSGIRSNISSNLLRIDISRGENANNQVRVNRILFGAPPPFFC